LILTTIPVFCGVCSHHLTGSIDSHQYVPDVSVITNESGVFGHEQDTDRYQSQAGSNEAKPT